MRVALAAALFGAPDVLLLDEPTNYLDLEGTIWLKSYIRDYPHTILLVSHDRDLLNEAVDSILHLDQGKLTIYVGNYDNFERQRREKQALTLKMKKKQDEHRDHVMAYLDRFVTRLPRAEAQSRLKALANLNLSRCSVKPRRSLPVSKSGAGIGTALVRWEKASVGYGDKAVLKNITLRLDPDYRMRFWVPRERQVDFCETAVRQLQVMGGEMRHPPRITMAILPSITWMNCRKTSPYDTFLRSCQMPRFRSGAQDRCGGFRRALADSKCSTLSGGEKARLLFMLATFHGRIFSFLTNRLTIADVDSARPHHGDQ